MKAQEEIDNMIPSDASVTVDYMGKLPYTEAVIYEIMRHSCIFPFALPHATTKDTFINGYSVPDKTLIFVNLWSTTRDVEKFPDPEKFDPNRFLETIDTTGSVCLNKSALENFYPFGIGRRR